MERLKIDEPPCWSSACCSHVLPTKPCGHIVSETKVTATGMGNRVRAAALRIMAACRGWRRAVLARALEIVVVTRSEAPRPFAVFSTRHPRRNFEIKSAPHRTIITPGPAAPRRSDVTAAAGGLGRDLPKLLHAVHHAVHHPVHQSRQGLGFRV